jgi:hypothetical protein
VLDQQEGAPGRGANDLPSTVITPLYTRTMPGGGYVKVELVVSDRGNVAHERVSGRVVIEPRNASPRRDDLAPLVVEEVEGEDENSVVAELFRIAQDNAALARRVLRQRTALRAD